MSDLYDMTPDQVRAFLHANFVRQLYTNGLSPPAAPGEATSLPCAESGVAGTCSEDVA